VTARAEPSAGRPTVPGIPDLPEVRQHLVSPAAPVTGRVVKSELCTAGRKAAGFVRHIDIDVSGTALEGAWRAGQSFGVVPPGVDTNGRPHKLRLYSIAAPTAGEDGRGTILSTTVKRTIDEHWDDHRLFLGVCSNHLCDLAPGAEVQLTGPAGKRFLLPADPSKHDYLFFATGTGIAPFRGMLADLAAAGFPSRAALVMGSPYASDLLYDAHFRTLERDHDNFTYLTAISREKQHDVDTTLYVQDRLETHRDLLAPMLASERTLIYICGIAGMELGILKQLARVLPPAHLSQYLDADAALLADPGSWDRRMIPRELKPTRRMFLEVY
jgi:ferredoxin--NADP+ reductase